MHTKRVGYVVSGVLLATLSHTAPAADLTVAAFGGQWEQSLRQCDIAAFEKATGKKVDVVLGTPVQWINQIAASPEHPPFDVIFIPSDYAFDVAQRGMAQKITPENAPNVKDLTPYFADIGKGYGVVHNYGSMGIIYNKKTVKNPPKSWQDFIKGTLAGDWTAAMPSINYPGSTSVNIWNFAKLEGGDEHNIQPGLDIIKKMQKSGNLEFWTDPNQVLNGLKSGEFDLAMYWDGRAWAFIDDGNKDNFGYISPAPGAVAAMTWTQVIKNARPLAMEFANFTMSAEAQGCFGSSIRYGVGNSKAKFDPAVEHEITKFDQLAFPPFVEINKLQNQWVEAWNKQIGR
ncbi:hypothetical protein CAL29_01355 [Bordetella genomosp. 10]|uniref:ABC transporter substrate-binding protein n=1 Tax=Bordetella genomosp. 10 TaxID=1416804 RepID=A0A261SJD0_9BORD|nr:extracellular solute-binding protein [Bordetella genomosp. 10]OZI37107.1 hypothetical protein CAL29_01355 [Bordetella genomosp. 10]